MPQGALKKPGKSGRAQQKLKGGKRVAPTSRVTKVGANASALVSQRQLTQSPVAAASSAMRCCIHVRHRAYRGSSFGAHQDFVQTRSGASKKAPKKGSALQGFKESKVQFRAAFERHCHLVPTCIGNYQTLHPHASLPMHRRCQRPSTSATKSVLRRLRSVAAIRTC